MVTNILVPVQGSRNVRESILYDFIEQCEGMTAPELEQQFCDCASLFLARLTAWIRLTCARAAIYLVDMSTIPYTRIVLMEILDCFSLTASISIKVI